jgi:sorting nexin-29
VKNAIQKLKDIKAPGIDLIQAELIKKASLDFVEYMHQLIIKIWPTETIPEDWNWSIICPIHKKGDSNYRGIRLLCVAYKIFSNILFNRLMPYVETTIGDYQCGYRQEQSTVDQIFTVRQILEKFSEYGKDTHHLFIDFKVAYDSIDKRHLYAAMEELNIPQKLIALVKATMNNTQCRVKIQNRLSEPINAKNGVRQGDALACLLFNIALEKVIRDAAVNMRGTTFYKSVQILAYADNIDIIGRTQSAMIEAFTSL